MGALTPAFEQTAVMFSFVMRAPPDPRFAPRWRGIAWWAVIGVCALHALAAWWLWRAADARPGQAPREQEVALTVDLLPGEAARARPAMPQSAPVSRRSAPASQAASVPVPESGAATPAAPVTQPLSKPQPAPVRQRPATSQTKSPPPSRAPSASAKSADGPAPAPVQESAGDFRWRGEDAIAQGMQRARGEPQVNLAPKARAEPSALAKGIAQSARPPCRDAHAHLGLLALPMLLADTVRDSGCKW